MNQYYQQKFWDVLGNEFKYVKINEFTTGQVKCSARKEDEALPSFKTEATRFAEQWFSSEEEE